MGYKLEDLIDIPLLQSLQEKLNVIYSFPSAIIDNEGNVLTAVAWQDICTKFHRMNPLCEAECIKSDQYIMDHLHEANPAVSYVCPHGLIDNATPIIIEGHHLGNFFTGQFFLEEPDLEYFREQAKKYGFNQEEYIEAVKSAPVWSQEKLSNYLDFISGFIEIIAGIGLNNLHEIEANRLIKESEERNRAIVECTSDWIWEVDQEGKYTYCSNKIQQILGYSAEEIIGKTPFDLMPPEDAKRAGEIFTEIRESKGQIVDLENWNLHKDGHRVCLLTNGFPIFDDQGSIIGYRGADKDITERKKTEEALIEGEKLLKSITENSPDAIFLVNREGKYVYANQTAADLLGYTPDEMLSLSIGDIGRQGIGGERFQRLLEQGKIFVEIVLRKKDGSLLDVDLNAVMLPNGLMYGSCRDLTERKRAMKEVQMIKERLQLATGSARIGIWDYNLEENKLIWDERMLELFGLAENEFAGSYEGATKNIHPDDVARIDSEMQDAFQGGGEFHSQFRVILPDGHIRFVEGHARVIFSPDGTPLQMTGVNWDITQSKEYEIQLSSILENSPTGFAINIISSGKVIYINKSFSRVYHVPPEVCHSVESFFEYVYGDQMELGMKILEDVGSGDPERMKWEGVPVRDKQTNSLFYVSAANILLADLDIMISSVWDVTEQVTHEKKLLAALGKATESDRLKSVFLATMSHELRTPLNAIIGFSDIIDEESSLEEILRYTKIINSNGNQLLNIIEDLLDISLIDSGEAKILKREEYVHPLLLEIHEIIQIEKQIRQKAHIDLNLIFPAEHPDFLLFTDPMRLKQVFLNLLKNSLKFTDQGYIEYGYAIDQQPDGTFIEFYVRDTGIGISSENQAIIFDTFRQVEDSYTKQYGGTGIGLTISKKLTELLGGNIWCESEEGKGTVFYFTIPLNGQSTA